MAISDLKWDELNEIKGLRTFKRYYSNDDSLRVFEFNWEEKDDPNRFKVLCRFDNSLKEYSCLNEKQAYNICIDFNLKEGTDAAKHRKEKEISEQRKALTYAKYIVTKCIENKNPITNLALQKALYMLQKEYIKLHQNYLFIDGIEAWKFGPCVPEVYYYYCGHGAMPIFGTIEKANTPGFIEKDPELHNLLNTIAEEASKLKSWELCNPEAWKLTYDAYGCYFTIPKEFIEWEIKNGY